MVMEAATLSSPQRKYNVVPVQKSLSLPSYARAGGEGIDHKLIFAALEQKEKVRRKSKIFTREKTARQNIFCLPIPSTNKCRETSFSSDTSCSSLEYQKPVKKDDPKKKAKDELSASTIQPDTKTNTNLPGTKALARNVHTEFKPFLKGIQDHLSREDPVRLNVENGDTIQSKLNKNPNPPVEEVRNAHSEFKSSFKIGQGHRSPVDTLRLNVGSSDSMDRSSRSSSDSFSRKERLVAIKARVEAAREKYGESSSEEESRSSMTRYNSDGSIHRSVREGKSRSTRLERRLRRRSQDEWGIKKTIRGNTSNLSLNTEGGDGIHLNLEKPARIDDDISHLDIKTDFCPSPNFPDLTKKSYFSDFPSRENSARSVQARIRYIEDEERKRRSGSDFREVIRTPLRQSPQHLENTSPASTERKRQCEWQNSQKNSSGIDLAMRSSPIPRASQAPTPPPRSPKSITFMNKTFMQRHNTNLLNHESSLDRKKVFQPNTPSMDYTKIFEQVNSINDSMSGDAKYSAKSITTSEKQINRELFSARRKTCGNFDFIDKNLLDDLCSIGSSAGNCNSPLAETKKYSSVTQIKRTDSKGYFSSSETTPFAPSEEDLKGKMWKSKWQENDQKREFMFNSLESKKKSNPPSWLKWTPPKTETCLCSLFPNNKLACICKSESDNIRQTNLDKSAVKLETFDPVDRKDMSSLTTQSPTARLCKSEVNIASNEPVRSSVLEKNTGQPYLPQTCENGKNNSKYNNTDKISATANLESAMLELESVYRSLKVSSDNLSDQNNTSIVSGNDNNNKPTNPKSNIYSFKDNLDFKRRLSICETDLKPDIKLGIDVPVNGTCVKYSKSNAIPPRLENSVPASCNGIPDVNQLSIDELFNDLTQQLNFEQKLLKEPRENFTPLPKDNHHFDNTKRTNSPSSQISIRKEFYDNLCKSNRNQSKNFTPIVHDNKISDTGVSVGKKRYKAVRSLSQNISYLMAADTNTTVDSNTVIKNGEAGNTSHTTLLDQPSPKYYEHVPFNPSKTAPKRDIATNRSNLFIKKDDENIAQNSKRDEIRHIRVSMDSNVHQPNPIAVNPLADARQYPRLSSAVGSSQVSPKSDVSKILPEETPSSDVASRENVDVLDEAGLEKLLNSLLGEVPERQQSSLLLGPTTTPPGASGEMSVLQHLDVIRLKPVPS